MFHIIFPTFTIGLAAFIATLLVRWGRAFVWGSIVATFMQGVILGGLLQGIPVTNNAFAGDGARRLHVLAGTRARRRGLAVLSTVALVALFLLGCLGLVASNAPYMVPPSLTVWQAAAAPSSQIFMLVGVLVMLPVILGYTVLAYWTFRGKVRDGEGYH